MYYHGLNRSENNMNETKICNSHEYKVCNTPEDGSYLRAYNFCMILNSFH